MAPTQWRHVVPGLGRSSKQGTLSAKLRQDAERLSERLPPLLVEADRIASTVAQGIHGRRRAGAGETFWQFRHHVSGDAAASIDWRQSAKSQNKFVRENEWDVAESIWLWCDTSASMDYAHTPDHQTKEHRAMVLALALGHLLLRAGERVGILGESGAPLRGVKALDRLGAWLINSDAGDAGVPPNVALPRHARIVVFGDFLAPKEDLLRRLEALAGGGARGHLVHVLDPAEEDFPFDGRTVFEGLEDTLELIIGKAETLREPYRQRLHGLKGALSEWSRHAGWSYHHHRTDKTPHLLLLQIFNVLSLPSGPSVRDWEIL